MPIRYFPEAGQDTNDLRQQIDRILKALFGALPILHGNYQPWQRPIVIKSTRSDLRLTFIPPCSCGDRTTCPVCRNWQEASAHERLAGSETYDVPVDALHGLPILFAQTDHDFLSVFLDSQCALDGGSEPSLILDHVEKELQEEPGIVFEGYLDTVSRRLSRRFGKAPARWVIDAIRKHHHDHPNEDGSQLRRILALHTLTTSSRLTRTGFASIAKELTNETPDVILSRFQQ